MKPYQMLCLAIVIFVCGAVAGRGLFPKVEKLPDTASSESEKKRKRPISIFAREGSDGTSSGAKKKPGRVVTADVSQLLSHIDPNDHFTTEKKLGALLDGLDASQLEELLDQLQGGKKGMPLSAFQSARTSLFNHLALADPSRALQFALALDDSQYDHMFVGTAMRALAKENLSAAVAAMGQITDKQLRNAARTSLIQVAMLSDPNVVAELLAENNQPANYNIWSPYGFDYGHGGSWFSGGIFHYPSSGHVTQWVQSDTAGAMAYAQGLTDGSQRAAAYREIATGLAQSDPDAAVAWAQGLVREDGKLSAMQSVVSIIAQTDPQRAVGLLDDVGSMSYRSSILTNIASSWIRQDEGAALDWLDSLPSTQWRLQAYSSAIHQVMNDDPARAATLIERLPLANRTQMSQQIATTWAGIDPEGALDWVTSLDPTTMNASIGSMFHTYSNHDPQAAMAFLENSDLPESILSGLYGNVAQGLSQQDPQAGIDWARGLQDDDQRRSALASAYGSFVSTGEYSTVASSLETIDDPLERQVILERISGGWATVDPDAMIEWFGGLDAADKSIAGNQAINSMAHSAPDQAAALYDMVISENEEYQFRHSANTIASAWVQHDPAAAAEWVVSVEDDDARRDAIDDLASQWVQYDTIGASGWIGSLPPGRDRDAATGRLVSRITSVDPASAFDWAQSIGDETAGFDSTWRVVQQWRNTDPEAARAAADSLGNLTPDHRRRLEAIFE